MMVLSHEFICLNERLILVATTPHGLSGTVTYEWANGEPPNCAGSDSDTSNVGFDRLDCDGHTTTGCAARSLVLRAGNNLAKLRLYVRVTVASSNGTATRSGTARIVMRARSSLVDGRCSVSASALPFVALVIPYTFTW